MPFDNLVSRTDAASLIPTDEVSEILKAAVTSSAALALFRQVRMSTKMGRVPVLSVLPQAYWVNGDTGLKQTTDVAWGGKELVAEEIAVIVPVPEAVIDDADYDIWGEIRPLLAEAVGIKLDQAIFSGTDKPATWTAPSVIPGATAAGNTVALGTATPEEGGAVGDLEAAMALVEDDGYDPSAFAVRKGFRSLLRRARDTTGQKLLDVSQETVEGLPVRYMPPQTLGTAQAVTGDFSLGLVGIRQDMTFKMLDQAVISDETGKVVLNLPQQDSLAMRVVARFAWAIGDAITRRETGATGGVFPFAAVTGT